jgi:hypothetical protein
VSSYDPKDSKGAIAPLLTSGDPVRLVFTYKDGNGDGSYEACFTFRPDDKKPGEWLSTKVGCPRAR